VARIRSIKPTIWESEQLGDVSFQARLTFIGLITQADDEGRLKGSPRRLRGKLFPYDDVTAKDVSKWLTELSVNGLITLYSVAGEQFISLPTWEKHQKINRPTDSALPSPSDADVVPIHGVLTEDSPQEGKGREGRGGEREADSSGKPSEFDSWLAHYRQTTGKESVRGSKPARTAFAARLKDGYSLEDLKAATVGCHSDDFCRNNGHDVPETILRAGKVERYIALASEAKPPPSRYDAKTEVLAA
jgi:hypothetical protein